MSTYTSLEEVKNDLREYQAPFIGPTSTPVDPAQTPLAGVTPTPLEADEPSLVADVALAPIRGVLEATESVADLVTFGNVPDGTINRLGHSKTAVGSFIETGTEFLVGFTPGFGWLSRASKLGKLAKLGKVGNYIAKSNVAKGAIAGAVADFSVFDEHQTRLSNLIESVPELQNPVTEYLASDQDDSLFEGRMKNALEGIAVGGMVDGIINGVKALKGAKRAVEAGDIGTANKILEETGNKFSDDFDNLNKSVSPEEQSTLKLKTAENDTATKAIGELVQKGWENVGGPFFTKNYPEGSVTLEVKPWQGNIRLSNIETQESARGKGLGTQALRDLTDVADTNKVKIEGSVKSGGGLPKEDLFAWYEKSGFQRQPFSAQPEKLSDNILRSPTLSYEDQVQKFLTSLKTTQGAFDVLAKPDATIDDLRASLVREGNRPIIDIFQHSGPVGTHKSVTALVSTIAEQLRAKKVITKPEALAEEIENIKNLGGEEWLKDMSSRIKDTEQLGNMVMGMKWAKQEVLRQWADLTENTLKAKEALDINGNDDVARMAYRKGFIEMNQLVPRLQEVLFGTKTLKSNIARGLAMARHTKADIEMAEKFRSLSQFWAKEPEKMGQLQTAIAEQMGDGDANLGFANFDEALRRLSTMYKKYGEDGLTKMAPDKFWTKLHNEWWINMLLSGTRTFAVNTIGNTISTMWKPFESALGAQMAYMRTGNPLYRTMRNQFWGQYGLMIDSAREALTSANNAFKTGDSSLVQGRTAVEEFQPIITKENFEAKLKEFEVNHPNASPLIKGIAKYLVTDATTKTGNFIRLPTRALLWMDEFTKHLNFRSSAKARALTEAYEEAGFKLKTGEIAPENFDNYIASFVDDKLNKLVMDGGGLYSMKAVRMRGIMDGMQQGKQGADLEEFVQEYVAKNFDEGKSNLAKYAYGYAEEVTFTKKGPKGSFQAGLERIVREHPALRLVMPFVTTPTNIIKFFGQRAFGVVAPLEGALKNLDEVSPELSKAYFQVTRELYSDDPFVRAQAEGKLAMGTAVMASAIGLWANGNITGQGPKDEKQRTLMQATGWQPYSFRFKKSGEDKYTYVSYQRFDPLATFLGVVADFGDKVNENSGKNMDAINFMGSAIGVALSKNITSKSYLTGIEQIMDAINQPDRKMEQFISTRMGSLVVPSIVSQAVPMGDPVMREARTFMDIFFRRVPGMTEGLDPKRNILGEPIKRPEAFGPDIMSPLFVSTEKKDRVMDEIAKLKYSFSQPPVIESGGVDLSTYKNQKGQSAYDRYLELVGTTTLNGKSLREALNKLVTSPKYLALPEDSEDGLDSPRIAKIREIISKYRASAKDKMISEFPELSQHRVLRDKLVLARRQGKTLEADALLRQLKME